jgi:Flp pilus assembly protein TadD
MRSAEFRAASLCAAALLAGCAGAPAQTGTEAPGAPATVRRAAADAPAGAYAEALELVRANRVAEAEAALRAAAAAHPRASGPLTNLGILYARSQRKAEARVAFERALALNPRNAVAHNWAGVLAREAGDLAQAERSYRAALDADPAFAPALLNLAFLYELYLQRPADALAAYRRYEALTGRKDARIAVWISELEARAGAAPAPAPAAKPPGGTTS